MNSLTRIMSYDKTVNQESCNCEECVSAEKVELENQIVEYSKLSDEEIEQIINERYSDKDKKTKTFIRKALKIHGNKYDYSNVVYIKAKEYVEIICKVEGHKPFPQTPNNHLNGNGCKVCSIEKRANDLRLTSEEFIEKANEVHGEGRYDYSKTKYIDYSTDVIIICHNHDEPYEFKQKPNNHLNGKGCRKCQYEKVSNSLKSNTKEFIEKANKIYGLGRYDYSEVEYVSSIIDVYIICHNHKIPYKFPRTPSDHLQRKGCPICANEKLADLFKLTKEEFIEKANKVHGEGTYDYSKVEYVNMKTDVIIICPIHGEFPQTPNSHIYGECGCSKCNKNKGEESVRKFLTENKIEFEEQKKFEGCKNVYPLRFDFYLPKYNLCIESDGNPHSEKINWNGKLTNEQMEKELKLNQKRDDIKNEYCKKNGIALLRVNNLKAYEELMEYFQNL